METIGTKRARKAIFIGNRTEDPESPDDGLLWHRSDLNEFRFRVDNETKIVASLDDIFPTWNANEGGIALLDEETSPADGDFFPMERASDGAKRKVRADNLPGGNGNGITFHYATKTDVYAETVGNGNNQPENETANIPGLSVSLTPESVNQKLRVWFMVNVGGGGVNQSVVVRVYQDGVPIFQGDEEGNRNRGTAGHAADTPNWRLFNIFGIGIKEAGTISETTFTIRIARIGTGSATITVNQTGRDDSTRDPRVQSFLMVEKI